MVKGVSRRVVVIRSPEGGVFEQAIFILKDDKAGAGRVDIVREACRIAGGCGSPGGKGGFLSRVPRPLFALAGAAVTAALWFFTTI